MEIRQLEYFREIATTGSINEAARRLNMSQPPLSYQMKQLEAELNVTLFERTRTGVTLTEAGKLLYERAENLLNFVSSTRQEVAEAGKKRVLRIGMTPTTVGTMMPFISEFARKNPDVNFEVHDGITYTLYNYLMDGIVDVAVVRTPLRLDGVYGASSGADDRRHPFRDAAGAGVRPSIEGSHEQPADFVPEI